MSNSRWNGREMDAENSGDIFGDADDEGIDYRGWDGVKQDQAASNSNGTGPPAQPPLQPAPAPHQRQQYNLAQAETDTQTGMQKAMPFLVAAAIGGASVWVGMKWLDGDFEDDED